MAGSSWVVRTITSPFRKGCILFHPAGKEKKNKQGRSEASSMSLHGEVMACPYKDVQVMWSILDKSKPRVSEETHAGHVIRP